MQNTQRPKKTRAPRDKKAVAFLKEVFTQAGAFDVNVRARLLEFGNTYQSSRLN
jgi:hypothetical protein